VVERFCEIIARLTGHAGVVPHHRRRGYPHRVRLAEATYEVVDSARSGARLHASGGLQEPYREDRPHKPHTNEKEGRERLGVPGDAADGRQRDKQAVTGMKQPLTKHDQPQG
jgi:hypothetical protein